MKKSSLMAALLVLMTTSSHGRGPELNLHVLKEQVASKGYRLRPAFDEPIVDRALSGDATVRAASSIYIVDETGAKIGKFDDLVLILTRPPANDPDDRDGNSELLEILAGEIADESLLASDEIDEEFEE